MYILKITLIILLIMTNRKVLIVIKYDEKCLAVDNTMEIA